MSESNVESAEKALSSKESGPLADASSLDAIISAIKSGESAPAQKPGGADILSGLLSNPEILAKLPSMIETVKPLLANLTPTGKTTAAEEQKPKKSDHGKRTALLLALKPYLGKERSDAIDYIVKISELTELLR